MDAVSASTATVSEAVRRLWDRTLSGHRPSATISADSVVTDSEDSSGAHGVSTNEAFWYYTP
jgi:hypothetical protein